MDINNWLHIRIMSMQANDCNCYDWVFKWIFNCVSDNKLRLRMRPMLNKDSETLF